MQLGMIGLGRMGGNITRRLMRGGREVVVYDTTATTRDACLTASALLADPALSAFGGHQEKAGR
jgi:6-phosphogluconate dehydrogenase